MDTDPREVQLAYVSRYRNAFRGRYLEDGEYRNGPVFQTEDEATFWAQRKREELERRASGETQHLPRGFYKTIPLHEEITTIGSVAGNTIVLSDPAVSRKHMGIRRHGKRFEFADLGSTNGVYINGHRVPKKVLSTGDIMRVGNTEMVFKLE